MLIGHSATITVGAGTGKLVLCITPPEPKIVMPPGETTKPNVFCPTFPKWTGIDWEEDDIPPGTPSWLREILKRKEKEMKNIKAGKPLIDFIKLCYHANKPPLLVGKHGVGKSEILEMAADQLGIHYICRDLSLMEPPDLVGMPKLEGGVTRFLPPAFLPTEGKGLLCFEELNRCPNYMRAPCLQLLTARCLNDYRLPDGWLPCAAINPSEDGYEVNDLDKALLSRFVKVQVVPDKQEWVAWATKNGISKEVSGYVNHDSKVFTDTSPRDWVMVDQLMKAHEVAGVTRDILGIAVQGVVGKERAAAFATFLKSGILLPPVVEVLADYNKYAETIKDLRDKGKTDVLGNLAHELMMHIQDVDNFKQLDKNCLAGLLKDLPPDTAETVTKFMKDKKYEVPKYRVAAHPIEAATALFQEKDGRWVNTLNPGTCVGSWISNDPEKATEKITIETLKQVQKEMEEIKKQWK